MFFYIASYVSTLLFFVTAICDDINVYPFSLRNLAMISFGRIWLLKLTKLNVLIIYDLKFTILP